MAKVVLSATLLILISMTSSSLTPRNAPCPESWDIYQNACYKMLLEPCTWFEAQAICENDGGYLMEIGSMFEERIILSFGKKVWIGLSDMEEEGNFVWANSQKQLLYSNWAPAQPDNYGGKENCVTSEFYLCQSWNDDDCMKRYPAICEKPFD